MVILIVYKNISYVRIADIFFQVKLAGCMSCPFFNIHIFDYSSTNFSDTMKYVFALRDVCVCVRESVCLFVCSLYVLYIE